MARTSRPSKASKGPTAAERARAERAALVATGLDQVEDFLLDLATHGLTTLTAEQVAAMGSLAELAGAYKLRALGRTLEWLQAETAPLHNGPRPAGPWVAGEFERLSGAERARRERGAQGFDERGWLTPLVRAWLTLAATRRALASESADAPLLAEELLGKTWRAKDLASLEDRELVELAFESEVVPTGFRIETSYLWDLDGRELYVERQITPLIVRTATPKLSYLGLLRVARAGVYPVRQPRRLKLLDWHQVPLEPDTWARASAGAEPSAQAVRAAWLAASGPPLAPATYLAWFRPAAVYLGADTPLLVDSTGTGLPLAPGLPGAVLAATARQEPVAAVLVRVGAGANGPEATALGFIAGSEGGYRLVRLVG